VYRWVLFFAVLPAAAIDESALASRIQARTDFDRVTAAAFPDLRDAARCVQSHAALLPAARPFELPVVRFRKGWCEMLAAARADSRAGYRQAAQDFAHAMAAWIARGPEPMPAGLQVASGVARLRAGADPGVLADIRAGLEAALVSQACPADLMPSRLCQELVSLGRIWLGWMSLKEGDLAGAARLFQGFEETGWAAWTAGRQALEAGRHAEAAGALARAVEAWSGSLRYPKAGVLRLLGPKPDLPEATAELGSAQYLAGDYAAAVQTLTAAVKARPLDARSIFIRGLARGALGQGEAALEDYQVASRTAFANPAQPSSGALAHFYRGVWHFRRQAWPRAEGAFASALNLGPRDPERADVAAWRHLAAVAGGACEASAAHLGHALAGVSGFFPRAEAEARLSACGPAPDRISSRR
jgi:tetratricopeptide (TPR) repeat protein